ncbi:MAG: hypothetical protein R2912_05835 [Eubacteriales bacterium]
MNITLSLFIVAGRQSSPRFCLLSHRAAKNREEALAAYCSANNYRLSITKGSCRA